jgi:hypothetical protein
MLGNGFIPEHISIAEESFILLYSLLPSLLPPLPAERIQLKYLYIAGDNGHLIDPVEHFLELLPPEQPSVIAQLGDILLYPLPLLLVELAKDLVDILRISLLVDRRDVLEEAREPREMVVQIILALDFLS